MAVIIGLVGDDESSKVSLSKVMSKKFDIKEISFSDILVDITKFAFPQISSSCFEKNMLEKTFESQGGNDVPLLRDNAKKILTFMVRVLGRDFKNFFSNVSPGKFAGGTYTDASSLLKRVDELVVNMMPDFNGLILSSKVKMNDVTVINDFSKESDANSFMSKYPNFFLVEVCSGEKKDNKKWYSKFDRETIEKFDDLSSKEVVVKAEGILKTIRSKSKIEVPFESEDYMSGDKYLRSGKFGFEKR